MSPCGLSIVNIIAEVELSCNGNFTVCDASCGAPFRRDVTRTVTILSHENLSRKDALAVAQCM